MKFCRLSCFITEFSCAVSKYHASCNVASCSFIGTSNFSKFFFIKSFFLAQLVYAQMLSALFPLRKFCGVASLKLNCLAWLVCLEILFNKNRYNENV